MVLILTFTLSPRDTAITAAGITYVFQNLQHKLNILIVHWDERDGVILLGRDDTILSSETLTP